MRVVFLDIDGVLNCEATFGDRRDSVIIVDGSRHAIDREMVALLYGLVSQTDARVVVSSTWRLMGVTKLRRILQAHGLPARYVIGCTPVIPGVQRGVEIEEWLVAHEDVDSWVILDDDADMAGHVSRLVQTSFAEGLTEKHIRQAREILTARALVRAR